MVPARLALAACLGLSALEAAAQAQPVLSGSLKLVGGTAVMSKGQFAAQQAAGRALLTAGGRVLELPVVIRQPAVAARVGAAAVACFTNPLCLAGSATVLAGGALVAWWADSGIVASPTGLVTAPTNLVSGSIVTGAPGLQAECLRRYGNNNQSCLTGTYVYEPNRTSSFGTGPTVMVYGSAGNFVVPLYTPGAPTLPSSQPGGQPVPAATLTAAEARVMPAAAFAELVQLTDVPVDVVGVAGRYSNGFASFDVVPVSGSTTGAVTVTAAGTGAAPVPAAPPSNTPPPPTETGFFCTLFPTAFMCLDASGQASPDTITTEQRGDVTPVYVGPETAQCPAPLVVHGASFSWQPWCDFLGMARPVFIALAYLSAAFIFLRVVT